MLNKHKILKILYFLTYWLGINKIFYFLNRKKQLILTYHNVLPNDFFEDLPHLGVSHNEIVFEEQIKFIKKRFSVTTKLGNPKSIIITFDDGYKNNFHIAHKILKKYGLKAIFFVPITKETLWIDKILMWISFVPEGTYKLLDLEIKIKNNKSRYEMMNKIWYYINENYNLKDKLIKEMDMCFPFKKLNIKQELKDLRFNLLNQEEIKLMKEYGHKIGCHSLNHDILSKLSEKELKEDIKICEKQIGDLYNTLIYSYPFGGLNEVSSIVVDFIKSSKFKYGVMNISKPSLFYSKYTLPRYSLPNINDKYVLDAKLSGLEYWLKFFKLFPNVKDYL